jgi:hypothetical protein
MSAASVLSAKANSLWKGTEPPDVFFPLSAPELDAPALPAETGRGEDAFSSADFQDSGMAFTPQDPW